MREPVGFYSFGRNIGIKNESLDFAVVYSEVPCRAACVFTLNNFPGAPIHVGREHIQDGKLQAIVINSKNSNVATGSQGIDDAKAMCREVANSLGIRTEDVLVSSTGVIGVPLPMEKILPACRDAKSFLKPNQLETVANAILTTDTKAKISVREITHNGQTGVIYGFAKGAGMIEPNMATMLCYILSDFEPESNNLYKILKTSVDKSFNCLSIDSDTSTSDTVALLCSGQKGKIPDTIFQETLDSICIELTQMIARDGEGASKLIEVNIQKGKSSEQVRKIGKSILNSPLVKTAIYGGDPNWGRFVMAVGKVFDEPIPYDSLEIYLGELSVKGANEETKQKLSHYLKTNEKIEIRIVLGTGDFDARFWGCDLTEGYVEENAYYTT